LNSKSKAETFIGFTVRSGKYKIGMNAAATLKKAYLILLCRSISENSLKDAIKLAKRFNCKIFKTVNKDLADMTFRPNSKIMAITDKTLAKSITDNSDKDLIEVNQEYLNG